MKNPKLIIENPYFLCAINNIKICIDKDKQKTVENIKHFLPELKSGFGGSHVWISTKEDKRIAIIYF